MSDISHFEAENILISSESLMEKAQSFINVKTDCIIFNDADDTVCLNLICELKQCIDLLEDLHVTYQSKLQENVQQNQATNCYAQALSLGLADKRGDISHVD